MSENNRNPIEKCRKRLSQFTTMNVIDGQAGLVIYSSLIFYSLTIDNILNIITEPENWTNGKVKVKITSNVTGITKEYSIDEGASWNIYENEIEVERNGTTIQARGKNATFGESVNLNSHMAKNSEWGATVYLAHSKYGTNKKKVEVNTSYFYAGGIETGIEEEIYTNNKLQSTTHNATGVYDLNGGAYEMVASYIGSLYSQYLKEYGGTNDGDLYGATEEEQLTSTKYKTVYNFVGGTGDNYENAGKKYKGDAVYETSLGNDHYQSDNAWFEAESNFPTSGYNPFFERGGIYDTYIKSGTFYFGGHTGAIVGAYSFRMTLTPQ